MKYRVLQIGEVARTGDQFERNKGEWVTFDSRIEDEKLSIRTIQKGDYPVRRIVSD